MEKFTTDMNKHEVVITGRIDPQKVLKKLKKKTGRRVEIIEKEKEESPKDLALSDCCKNNEVLMMFNDENPNACWIM